MEQSGTSALLQGVVQDLASGVAAALRGGGHAPSAGEPLRDGPADGVALAAVRVLGADVLLPHVLFRTAPDPHELAAVRTAVQAFPPRPDAAPAVAWSHWGMTRALHRVDPGSTGPPDGEPVTGWLRDDSWQSLTHRLAVLAALAVPGEDSAVARGAQQRVVDLSRGFVRAVRRRNWRQAAGAGRWLALLRDVPDTLGLDAGLDFVELMGDGDACVALQVRAARLMRSGVAA
ncbi:hypothetical protein C3489_28100 [Streptomyces sp. Ru71]|uniref:hypothetical protein n=1 Tax=Streptomyces sp. Ru71 TaxID=2080746 RepID=UPI000CDDB3DE|nr:hypothetical protein [Streptomyces sp. Ru71]POX48101.1 hypothetical protein C3489_28100 [Streptomyces sp. Ru71]